MATKSNLTGSERTLDFSLENEHNAQAAVEVVNRQQAVNAPQHQGGLLRNREITYSEAISSPDEEKWQEVVGEEKLTLQEKEIWIAVPLSKGICN